MGRHQTYRGNPTTKQYYVVNNFSGGINRNAIDEAMGDYEFRDLVNVDLGKQGIVQSRKGFGEIEVITNLLDIYNITIPTGQVNLFKVLENKKLILENMINNINYTYQWILSTESYWTDNGEVDGIYDVGEGEGLPTPTDINLAGRDLDGGGYYYNRSTYSFEGSLKILTMIDNKIYLLTYDGTTLSFDEVLSNSTRLPSVSSYKENLTGVNTVDYVGKIYISLSDISERYKGILIYDRDDDTFTVWRGEYLVITTWTVMDSNLLTDVYKPKPYDISNISSESSLTQGFNVLYTEPLLYIDRQGTGLQTIRALILTDSSGNYLDKIPTSGDFFIRVITTGGILAEQLRIVFKDQDGNSLNFEIGDTIVNDYGEYLNDDAVLTFPINNLVLTGVSYVLIDVLSQTEAINKLDKTEADLEAGDFNTLNNYYVVKDEEFVYKMTSDYLTGNGGRDLDDYTKLPLNFKEFVSDITSFTPSTLFSSYTTSGNDGALFLAYDSNNNCKLYEYTHSGTVFTEITATDNVYHDNYQNFIPFNGTLIQTSDNDSFYRLHYNISASRTLNTVNKSSIDFTSDIIDLEGQFFEVGDAEVEEPIEGFDLEGVKFLEISDRLVYYKGNSIYFSNTYQFDYVPNFAFVLVPLEANDEIVSINYFNGSYIIFSKYTIWKMTGTYGTDDWSLQTLNYNIGCIAPKSIRGIENTLYFVSEDGLYRLKQNYYLEGLENVAKMDKNVPDLIDKKENLESIYLNEQYFLYTRDYDYDAIRMYVNITLPDKQHPFVADKFSVYPDNIFKNGWNLLSIKNGKIYHYGTSYTDFLPSSDTEVDEYLFTVRILTPRLTIGYPSHNKKFKAVYIKTYYNGNATLYVTGLVDGFTVLDPNTYLVTLNDEGELEYTEYNDPELDSNMSFELNIGVLGSYELGDNTLGDSPYTTHKIVVGEKGKNIQLLIEHKSNANFGIVNMGYLYKLGKVKED